jgi:Secretion system C-terminal sorting domain
MRLILSFLSCCLSVYSLAQVPEQALRIQISYQKPGQYLEQAIETIEAVNVVSKATTVEYRAGRSVMLRPGFEAKSGSTFTANIKPVDGTGERPLQLTAFPNPFEQSTTIEYYLPASGTVNLSVTDAQGKIVGYLVQGENQPAGRHQINWKPGSLSSGVYMPVIESNQQKAVSRLIKK